MAFVIRLVVFRHRSANGDSFEWGINLFNVRGVSSAAQFWVYFLQLAVPHLTFNAMEGGSICISMGH